MLGVMQSMPLRGLMKRALSLLLLPMLTVACATPQAVAPGISGLEQFQAHCTNEPAALTDQDVDRYTAALDAAMALPTDAERLAALKTNVLEPLMAFAGQLRRCGLYDRSRADRLLALAARYNQLIASETHGTD